MELLQLIVGGVAQGCVYGLIALGFVLIYKATEMVNFAQGDLMMLGAFVALTFIGTMGMNYWLGVLVAALAMAVFGYLLDALVLRRIIGQPQFAVVILTISIGFLFRSFAGFIWGHETQNFPETPFTNRIVNAGGVILSLEHLSIICGTLILAVLLYLFFNYTRLGNAMQASSQNQLAAYYMGMPVKHINSLIWGLSAIVATVAGVLLAPVSWSIRATASRHQGVRGSRHRRLRQPARHGAGRPDHRRRRRRWRRATCRPASRRSSPISSCSAC